MTALRAFIRTHRQLAAVLLALVLCLKAVLPAGYMVSQSASSVVTITICADASSARQSIQMVIPAKNTGDSETAQKTPHCAFTGLGDQALGGSDAVLLALAIAFILALGFAPAPPLLLATFAHLRPPLRGPPLAS